MTQEEKAKRYDEALEIAKKNYVTAQDLCEGSQIGVECFKNTLESIFPELEESEDDRIRKELTEFLKKASGGFLDATIQCKTFSKWAAWLEKQGGKGFVTLKEFQDAFEKKAKQYEITLPNRSYDIHAFCEELYNLYRKQNKL